MTIQILTSDCYLTESGQNSLVPLHDSKTVLCHWLESYNEHTSQLLSK